MQYVIKIVGLCDTLKIAEMHEHLYKQFLLQALVEKLSTIYVEILIRQNKKHSKIDMDSLNIFL